MGAVLTRPRLPTPGRFGAAAPTVLAAVLAGSLLFAGRETAAQDRPLGQPAADVQRFAALVAPLRMPDTAGVDALQAPARRPCPAAAVPALLRAVAANDYGGRAGSFALAAQIAACGTDAASGLLDAFTATGPDGPSLAVVSLAAKAISPAEYDALVDGWLSRLAEAGGRVLNPFTALALLQWEAGRCVDALSSACLRDGARRVLSAGWSADPASTLAFGDLLALPFPTMAEQDARTALHDLMAQGLPLRADLLAALPAPARDGLEAVRRGFLQRMFGPNEEL